MTSASIDRQWIPARMLAEFLELRLADYVRSWPEPSKGTSRFCRHLRRQLRSSDHCVIALDHLYERRHAERLLVRLARDLRAFCDQSSRRLLRAQCLDPIRDTAPHRTGLLFQFSRPGVFTDHFAA